MSLVSLEGSVRTCKVNTAWANRIQSDRFENPSFFQNNQRYETCLFD